MFHFLSLFLLVTTFYIRPILSTNSNYNFDLFKNDIDYSKYIYNSIGIELIYLDPIKMDICSTISSNNDIKDLEEFSNNYIQKNHEIPIFFMDRIVLPDIGVYEGLTYDITVAISKRRSVDTLAHELGHEFGLDHIWESDSSYIDDCISIPDRYNLMGYCHIIITDDTILYAFSDQQIYYIDQYINQYLKLLLN